MSVLLHLIEQMWCFGDDVIDPFNHQESYSCYGNEQRVVFKHSLNV